MHVIRWKLGLSNGSDAHAEIQGQNWTTGELLLQSSDVENSILKPPKTHRPIVDPSKCVWQWPNNCQRICYTCNLG